MNENIKLVEKSLDTINPEWEMFLVASVGKNGFEYDTFSKNFSSESEFLSLVNASTIKDLENLFPE